MSDLLRGCRAKIERATETTQNLECDLKALIAANRHAFSKRHEFRRDGKEYVFIIAGELFVPPRFSILAGEIVHNLRSSLDHLIYALVLQNGCQPTRKNQFPLCTDERFFEDCIRRGFIYGVSDRAGKLIRSVQPFCSSTPDDTILHVIQQYDNQDKHQLLLVVSTVMAIGDQIRLNPKRDRIGISGMSPPGAHKVLKEGVAVFTIDFVEPVTENDFEADAEFTADFAFENCGHVRYAPLIPTLRRLIQGTTHTISLFEGEFGNSCPSPSTASRTATP
jgi:hypothetical protein